MKIKLMVILPLYGFGGTEKVLSTIVENIDKQVFDVFFVIIDNNKEVKYSTSVEGVEVIDLECDRVYKSGLKIKRIISKYNIDIVLTGQTHLNLYVSILKLFGFLGKSKLVLRESIVLSKNIKISNKILKYLYKNILTLLYNNSNKIIAQSNDMLNDLVGNFQINKGLIVKINNPIKSTENSFSLNNSEIKQVVAVGRFVSQKGFDRMIRIVSTIKDVKFNLTICGDGPDRKMIEDSISKYNLNDKVNLLGMVKNTSEILSRSDLLIMTSYYEGFPNVLLEAGINGLPVVCFECPGGVNEIIVNAEKGFMISNDNEGEFAQKIILALSTNFDKSKIVEFTKERFSVEHIMNLYKNVLLEVCNLKN